LHQQAETGTPGGVAHPGQLPLPFVASVSQAGLPVPVAPLLALAQRRPVHARSMAADEWPGAVAAGMLWS
jgi:hypothetical protein